MKKNFLLLIFVAASTVSYAQLGNLIKKVKENVTKDKTIPVKNIPNIKTSTETSANADVQNPLAKETEWQLAADGGYSESGARYSYEQVERKEKLLGPYTHIRKTGEQGCFHFAKDYSELQKITEPEIKNVTIIFSSEPFKGGNGTPAVQFNSSKSHIYACLKVDGSNIKEVLKLNGDNPKLTVDFYVYPADVDEFYNMRGQTILYLNKELVKKSSIDFDIMPRLTGITIYNDPTDRYMFYISFFPQMHTKEYFLKSGNYRIGVKVSAPLTDEWGNNTGKKAETMGFFDYAFEVKDAQAILDEGQMVRKSIQSGVKFTPKPMAKEWKMQSAAPVISGYTAAKYNQLYTNYYKDVKIIKTYLSQAAGAAWKVIMSNDNVMPAYKYCTQTVFFFVKDASGNCYYHPCDVRQNYTGGGTYGPMQLAVFDEEKVYVNCEEMK
jgi:hypothetical protein